MHAHNWPYHDYDSSYDCDNDSAELYRHGKKYVDVKIGVTLEELGWFDFTSLLLSAMLEGAGFFANTVRRLRPLLLNTIMYILIT